MSLGLSAQRSTEYCCDVQAREAANEALQNIGSAIQWAQEHFGGVGRHGRR